MLDKEAAFQLFITSDLGFQNFQKCIQRKQSEADQHVCMREFTAASFIRVKEWKQPKCPVIGDYINKLGSLHENGKVMNWERLQDSITPTGVVDL